MKYLPKLKTMVETKSAALESINKKLQGNDTTLTDVRDHFDFVIESFPSASSRLKANADIVHSPAFETAVVKVQLDKTNLHTSRERVAFQVVELRGNADVVEEDKRASFTKQNLKGQRLSTLTATKT